MNLALRGASGRGRWRSPCTSDIASRCLARQLPLCSAGGAVGHHPQLIPLDGRLGGARWSSERDVSASARLGGVPGQVVEDIRLVYTRPKRRALLRGNFRAAGTTTHDRRDGRDGLHLTVGARGVRTAGSLGELTEAGCVIITSTARVSLDHLPPSPSRPSRLDPHAPRARGAASGRPPSLSTRPRRGRGSRPVSLALNRRGRAVPARALAERARMWSDAWDQRHGIHRRQRSFRAWGGPRA